MDDFLEAAKRIEAMRATLPPRPEPKPLADLLPKPRVPTPEERAEAAARAEARLAEEAEREASARQDRRREHWKAAGFPARHSQRAWDREEHGAKWMACRARVLDIVSRGGMVALIGPFGTGKTQLAASVACEACMTRGVEPQYWRAADLIGRFKTQVFGEGLDEHRFLQRMARVGLVVIDEVQDRYGSDTEELTMRRIVDHRYGALAPLILISNLSVEGLTKTVRGAVMSRIREHGEVIECAWDDYREASHA